MALVCVTSVRAAPGASTLAVLASACWPRPVALLEADPSGGALAVRYRLGRTPGLAGLAAAVRNQDVPVDALWAHAQMLPGDLPVIVAPESGEVTTRILRDAAHSLAEWCRNLDDVDVIVDCGRLGVQDVTWPLCAASDALVVVTRPRAEELYPVAHRLRAIGEAVRSAGVVLVGERPHSPTEIAEQLGLNIMGVVADDARAAGVLTFGGSSRGLRRSPLVRSVRTFVDGLFEHLELPLPITGALDTGPLPAGELTEGDRGRATPLPRPTAAPPPPGQQGAPRPTGPPPPPPGPSPAGPGPGHGTGPTGPAPAGPTGLPPEYVERSRAGAPAPPPPRAVGPPPPGELPAPPPGPPPGGLGQRMPPPPARPSRPGASVGPPRPRPTRNGNASGNGHGSWRGGEP
jgi:MinD-like ATPase involved in chromosome partitioning or flagellar assembly